MITGFEELTRELTDIERAAMKAVVVILNERSPGPASAITNKALSAKVEAISGIRISGSRMRKIIHAIRAAGLVPLLIATSRGYYRAETREQAVEYIESLRQREAAIREVRAALEKQYYSAFNNDLTLFKL